MWKCLVHGMTAFKKQIYCNELLYAALLLRLIFMFVAYQYVMIKTGIQTLETVSIGIGRT